MSQAFYQLSPPKFLPLSPVPLLLPGDCRQSKHHCYKRYKYHLEQNLLPPRFPPTPTPTPQMSLFSPLLVKLRLQNLFQIHARHMPSLAKKKLSSFPPLPSPKSHTKCDHHIFLNLQHTLGLVRGPHMDWVSFKQAKVSQLSILSLRIWQSGAAERRTYGDSPAENRSFHRTLIYRIKLQPDCLSGWSQTGANFWG